MVVGCEHREEECVAGAWVSVNAHGTRAYADMTVVSILALGMEAFLQFLHPHGALHRTPIFFF